MKAISEYGDNNSRHEQRRRRMGPKNKCSKDERSFENSGEQFQKDLNELYGEPEEGQDEVAKDEQLGE